MSAPPPAFPPQAAENPDRRPLPEGYIARYDERYAAWYYVDTRAQPPRSSWQHPQGPPTSPQLSTTYPPPSNPPPNRAYNSGSPSYPGQYGAPQYNQTSSYPSGYEGGQPDQRNFPGSQQYPTQGYSYPGQGWQQGGWQQPQQPPAQVYTQPQRRHGGGGMGTALLAGGGGLLAGAVIGEAFEHHEEREREEDFDQGYMDGQLNDGQDNDFGGGW